MDTNYKNTIAPELRFPEFHGDWQKKILGEIMVERTEHSTITDELPLLSFTIEEGVIYPESKKTNKRDFLIKDKDNKKYSVVRFNDIVYNPANVVYGAIHRNSLRDGVVSPICKIFYTNQDAIFMGYIVRIPKFIQTMTIYMEGTVQKLKTLKSDSFLKLDVCIPSTLPEQRKIAACLSSLDDLITHTRKKVDLLKQHKKGLMQKLFPKKDSNIPELRFPEFSGDWQVKRLGEIAELCAGATPSTSVSEYWENGTISWMSSGEVNNGQIIKTDKKISEIGYKNSSTKLVPHNTVVIALAGQGKTRGMVAITRIELCTNQSLCAVIPNNIFDSDYMYFYLGSKYNTLREISSGDGTRGGLNLQMLKNFIIPIPTLAEQQEIAVCLSSIDAEIERYEAKHKKLQEHKKEAVRSYRLLQS